MYYPYTISLKERCIRCDSPLWINSKNDFYCTQCRVLNDEKFDINICIICSTTLVNEDLPVILFAKPPHIFCEKCFKELLKLGFVNL